MGKHTLKINYDYDFALIGISSHAKDYRLCWALNKALEVEFTKTESLEINSKNDTPSFFSLFKYENEEEFVEYFVIANLSENKLSNTQEHSLFSKKGKELPASTGHGILIPEQKQMNYFFLIRGEFDADKVDDILKKIKSLELVLTALELNVAELKSKKNLIF